MKIAFGDLRISATATAAAYLDQVLADGDQQELMLALRRLAEAFRGVPGLAQQTRLNATTL